MAVAVSADAPACEAVAASACSSDSSVRCQQTGTVAAIGDAVAPAGLFARIECPVAQEKLAEIETQRRTVAEELSCARERLDQARARLAALRSAVSVAGN